MPPQHCAPVAQASPSWLHHDEALHFPWKHSLEQHSLFMVQVFPSVFPVHRGEVSGAHIPPVQLPLQQAPFVVQA
jgi:hypothetical protein